MSSGSCTDKMAIPKARKLGDLAVFDAGRVQTGRGRLQVLG